MFSALNPVVVVITLTLILSRSQLLFFRLKKAVLNSFSLFSVS